LFIASKPSDGVAGRGRLSSVFVGGQGLRATVGPAP